MANLLVLNLRSSHFQSACVLHRPSRRSIHIRKYMYYLVVLITKKKPFNRVKKIIYYYSDNLK